MTDVTAIAGNHRPDYPRVAVLAAGPRSGPKGGAERFFADLAAALSDQGCRTELISVPADEGSFEEIVNNYAAARKLDLAAFDMVVSTKAPTYAVNHPRHVLYLVHTVRVYDDMFSEVFRDADEARYRERCRIHELDFQAMLQVKARFAIGHEVASRLFRWRGLTAEVMHPPLGPRGFRRGAVGDYFFLPGRLHPWKRVQPRH